MSAAKHISPASVGISAALDNRHAFREGMRDGIPIALGYFAVSFSLGIQMGNIGLSAFQGWLMSALVNASAGEYAALTAELDKLKVYGVRTDDEIARLGELRKELYGGSGVPFK